jgi:hypothetical protein
MAQASKIHPITKEFVESCKLLKLHGELPRRKLLAQIMGINNISTFSEIHGLRQNIQPDQWKRFKKHFGDAIIKHQKSLSEPDQKMSNEIWLKEIRSISIDFQTTTEKLLMKLTKIEEGMSKIQKDIAKRK